MGIELRIGWGRGERRQAMVFQLVIIIMIIMIIIIIIIIIIFVIIFIIIVIIFYFFSPASTKPAGLKIVKLDILLPNKIGHCGGKQLRLWESVVECYCIASLE